MRSVDCDSSQQRTPTMPATTISDMPDEIMLKILSAVHRPAPPLAHVCRRWAALATVLPMHVKYTAYFKCRPAKDFASIAAKYPNTRRLEVTCSATIREYISGKGRIETLVLPRFRKLHTLIAPLCDIPLGDSRSVSAFLDRFLANAGSVEYMLLRLLRTDTNNIRRSPEAWVVRECSRKVAVHCPNIRHLFIEELPSRARFVALESVPIAVTLVCNDLHRHLFLLEASIKDGDV